ncbi:serine/threonine-protein kinase [Actinoplanes campanulatus]|uniref:non-specific serine/threonine protein kinase n=1 Tax=Actinoplanes campanulatus TaxID=113559 RepID=A0A7W5AP61_9ACTN|nr:Stk1 family PASTA domain-containing Ser/Thr kinase [Actinoplanes campanulatus]MBB3099710.1 serine/threonine-protein kinase [Actinoplanes campanulatus]GGN25586.1 serine/threonine protein kinase [Actinoplanes campanulatus]GID39392.1 serine/threonine protein kinase [Actinoplanes campanulatus]
MTAQARLLGGRYQVGELLGYGGMAEVHRGRDLRLGRDVAIKMLRTDLARDATFQERFRREAQNSAALNHPAIVAVYDTGEEVSATGEKLPFIVMEFVNGRTLKEVLAQEQRLQPRRALEIIADIDAALEFSHRHGIIHRDIKPGNVMITQNGQVKVMDFGIARALASGATTMTQTSAVIGTAQYLSPEQARGESVDARSDVYAAGCVLFELVIGHPPFVGDSPVSVAYQHVREDPRTPSSINRDIPPDIDAIVLKALAKNPLNRYQSAQEMRADALRAVSGRPVMATPVMSQAETVAMTGGPRQQWQPQAATTMQRPVSPGMGAPQKPESRSSWVMAAVAGVAVLVVVVLGVALAMDRDKTPTNNEPQAVPMPTLVGLTVDQANAELARVKLTNIAPQKPTTGEDCDGKIAKQFPDAGTTTELTQQVTYQVCSKPDEVPVPEGLVGGTSASAKKTLEGLGLEVDFRSIDSVAEKGQVLEVESEGEKVAPGTTITVKVSNNNLVVVPEVLNRSQEAAEALLEANFLTFDVVFVQADGEPGTVISQDPKPGKKVKKNTQVKLQVIAEAEPNPSGSPSPDTTGTGAGVEFD